MSNLKRKNQMLWREFFYWGDCFKKKNIDSPDFCWLFRWRTNELRDTIYSSIKEGLAILLRNVKSKISDLSSNFLESLPSLPNL